MRRFDESALSAAGAKLTRQFSFLAAAVSEAGDHAFIAERVGRWNRRSVYFYACRKQVIDVNNNYANHSVLRESHVTLPRRLARPNFGSWTPLIAEQHPYAR